MNVPTAVWLFIFCYLPMIGIVLAFKDYRYDLGIWGSRWIGLQNFDFLFHSNIAWRITRNTVGMNLLFIVFSTVFSVGFGILLSEVGRKFVKVYQTVMFLPHYLSWVVVAYLFLGLFDMEHGLLNQLIVKFGGESVLWYSKPSYWPYILVMTDLWKSTGFGAIIYFTAIIGINPDYYEAAQMDGATWSQRVRHITLPMLAPTVVVLTLISVGNIFRADFGMFYFLTQNTGTLYPTTDVIDTYVFRTLKDLGDIGMGTAAGLYQAIVGLALVTLVNWIVRRADKESALY
ncbi:ABC transporter permease [Paenibacillus cymbidii]|uniref:ABC transporter permease n=1 Tax=Paenibacillus cymbidii TaxID=1639034 RepID=UPI001F47EE58|nr:ABC transporter permease subunit [Paenibacillus cymbidii]